MLKMLNVFVIASFLAACAETKVIETIRIVERPVYVRNSTIIDDGASKLNYSSNISSHCEPYPHPESDLYRTEARIRNDLTQLGLSEDVIRREILKTRSAVCQK